MNKEKEHILVTYSGGRDSSSSAILMSDLNYYVKLFTFQSGAEELAGEKGDTAPSIRHQELLKSLGTDKISQERIICGNSYLIRKLAIEKTNKTHVVYPIALALAVHSEAIIYCLKNDIKHIACGYSGYQASQDRYIEQREDFIVLMTRFLSEYKISYHHPISTKSKIEVIDILEKRSVSSNSLENKSVFGAIEFDVEKAVAFWEESLDICKEYIKSNLN